MERSFFIPYFWPWCSLQQRRVFAYSCPDDTEIPFRSVFYFDPEKNCMRYHNSDMSERWLNTWYYSYRPGFGIAEWRDDHPLTGWRRFVFGTKDRHVFATAIGWGEYAEIGSVYENYPVKNTLQCWPPMFATGRQLIHFERFEENFTTWHGVTYRNVLVFRYKQTFGGRSFGARYFNAQDIGPVAIEWIDYRDDGTMDVKTRVDAIVTEG